MPRFALLATGLIVLILTGCAGHTDNKPPKHPFQAVLQPVAGSGVEGTLQVTAIPGGIRIHGQITGLAPGSAHALHLHTRGDCTAPNGGSPGGHFNPRGGEHGDPVGLVHHAGDMANQIADAQGRIELDTTIARLSVDSQLNDDVLGRSLVLRAGADDYTTQPDGGGGPAIACGVITKKP